MISKETLDFLVKLKKNNNRDWFEKNREKYLAAKENVSSSVEKILNGIRKFDKRIPADLSSKDCLFRIYRDVRFSKDKKPYKTNMGAGINPAGKKDISPGYYIHVEPGNVFVAGGMWMPPGDIVNKIRQEIDYNTEEFEAILHEKSFRKRFNGLDQEHKLSTFPRGYPKDHPAMDHLKLKSFIAFQNFSDSVALSGKFEKEVAESLKSMYPLIRFLQRAID